MMSSQYARYGIADIVINANESDELPKYVTIRSGKDGDIISESEIYWVCDEDSDGNEIEHDRNDKD